MYQFSTRVCVRAYAKIYITVKYLFLSRTFFHDRLPLLSLFLSRVLPTSRAAIYRRLHNPVCVSNSNFLFRPSFSSTVPQ